MQGHVHKRVRTDKAGKEHTLWYVVVDVGVDGAGRRRQKWHGSFRTRKQAEVARAKLVDDLHLGSYVTPGRTTLAEWVNESWLPMTATRVKPTTPLISAESRDPRPSHAREQAHPAANADDAQHGLRGAGR